MNKTKTKDTEKRKEEKGVTERYFEKN